MLGRGSMFGRKNSRHRMRRTVNVTGFRCSQSSLDGASIVLWEWLEGGEYLAKGSLGKSLMLEKKVALIL